MPINDAAWAQPPHGPCSARAAVRKCPTWQRQQQACPAQSWRPGAHDPGAGGFGLWEAVRACTRPPPCCPHRAGGELWLPRLMSTPPIMGPPSGPPKAQHHPKATLPNAVLSGLGLQFTDPGTHTHPVHDALSPPNPPAFLRHSRLSSWPTAVPKPHTFSLWSPVGEAGEPAWEDTPPSSLCRVGGHLIPAEAEPRAPTAPSASHPAFWAPHVPAPAAHTAPGRVLGFTSRRGASTACPPQSAPRSSTALLVPGILSSWPALGSEFSCQGSQPAPWDWTRSSPLITDARRQAVWVAA